jgi:uncharacterized OB-fold protein
MQIPRHWRLNSQRYALQGVTCPHCSANIFPPRDVCPYCEARTEAPFRFEQTTSVGLQPVVDAAPLAAR